MRQLTQLLLLAALFSACQQNPAPPPPPAPTDLATTVAQHRYWVSKVFNDGLFAANVSDTLSMTPCMELVFTAGDTVLLTSCLSDAGFGIFKALDANTLSIIFEGDSTNVAKVTLDRQTGLLHLAIPGEGAFTEDFVAQDGIPVQTIDNVTLNLGRKRLAGKYTPLPGTSAGPLQLNADGTQTGLGPYHFYEPWVSGIGSGSIQDPNYNLMYLVRDGGDPTQEPALAWRLRGDTLRIWDTKNVSENGDMPEYKITGLRGAYLKN